MWHTLPQAVNLPQRQRLVSRPTTEPLLISSPGLGLRVLGFVSHFRQGQPNRAELQELYSWPCCFATAPQQLGTRPAVPVLDSSFSGFLDLRFACSAGLQTYPMFSDELQCIDEKDSMHWLGKLQAAYMLLLMLTWTMRNTLNQSFRLPTELPPATSTSASFPSSCSICSFFGSKACTGTGLACSRVLVLAASHIQY